MTHVYLAVIVELLATLAYVVNTDGNAAITFPLFLTIVIVVICCFDSKLKHECSELAEKSRLGMYTKIKQLSVFRRTDFANMTLENVV